MDTITTYLDSLFASLPDNDKTRQAKADMLANMRDYYRDLLREGKSEEAAIGAVISAFGSIDELRADLGMPAQATATTTQSDPPMLRKKPMKMRLLKPNFAASGTWPISLPPKLPLVFCFAPSVSPCLPTQAGAAGKDSV